MKTIPCIVEKYSECLDQSQIDAEIRSVKNKMLLMCKAKRERVERLLSNTACAMSSEEINQRFRCDISSGGCLEKYYCDDKLLFEVEFIPVNLEWIFRIPGQKIGDDMKIYLRWQNILFCKSS